MLDPNNFVEPGMQICEKGCRYSTHNVRDLESSAFGNVLFYKQRKFHRERKE